MKKQILFLLCLFVALSGKLQAAGFEESMHSAGKINVVFGVIGIIFAGIVLYLFMIDRKIKKIEKELKDK